MNFLRFLQQSFFPSFCLNFNYAALSLSYCTHLHPFLFIVLHLLCVATASAFCSMFFVLYLSAVLPCQPVVRSSALQATVAQQQPNKYCTALMLNISATHCHGSNRVCALRKLVVSISQKTKLGCSHNTWCLCNLHLKLFSLLKQNFKCDLASAVSHVQFHADSHFWIRSLRTPRPNCTFR